MINNRIRGAAFGRVASVAVALVTGVWAASASADPFSVEYAQDYARDIERWIGGSGRIEEIACANARIASTNAGIEAVSKCARVTFDTRTSATGNYNFTKELRSFTHKGVGYVMAWISLESHTRVYLQSYTAEDAMNAFSNKTRSQMLEWGKERSFSAGLTRHYRYIDATHKSGADCMILTGKRGKRSVAMFMTCSKDRIDRTLVKAVLKSFR